MAQGVVVAEHRRADGLRESNVPELEALLIPVEPAAYPASRSGSLVWQESRSLAQGYNT